MIVLVCGGREYSNYERMCDVLEEVDGWGLNGITTIIQGGARGADRLARQWAEEHRKLVVEVPADWKKHGQAAGPIRNKAMVLLKPDQGIVFPGGAGTLDMLTRLFKARVNTWIVSD